MYCVKCGVSLQNGVEQCPLCHTPVWNPDKQEQPANFSRKFPVPEPSVRYPALAFITLLLIAVCLSVLIYCLNVYHKVYWSGYVMLGIAVFYISLIFPFWFDKRPPLVFSPLAFGATCGYLLYICLYNGGHWFLSFAFPVVMIAGVITTAAVTLFNYIKHSRIFITGGLFIAIGGMSMLIEFFECITFGTKMFTWSLYSVSFFSAIGLFLVISGFIRPMREYLQRKLFF